MKATLIKDVTDTTARLTDLLSSFDETQLNTIPFENSWTAGQVAQHVYRSDILILRTLHSAGKKTNRPPNERVEDIRSTFLNFNVKFSSPKEIIPDDKRFTKTDLLNDLKNSRGKIVDTIKEQDLNETCADPIFGEITRLELIHFVITHTQRHIYQLITISKMLLSNQQITL